MNFINNFFILFFSLIFSCANIHAQSYGVIQPSGSASGGTTDAGVINNYYKRNTLQFIYTKTELNAAGIVGGATIEEISWFVITKSDNALPDYEISMKHTTLANVLTNGLGTSGWTTVKNAFAYQAQSLTDDS